MQIKFRGDVDIAFSITHEFNAFDCVQEANVTTLSTTPGRIAKAWPVLFKIFDWNRTA